MTKFILDKDIPLEWDAVFDALIKEWEKNLKNFKDRWSEKLSEDDEFLLGEALSMPCFEVSTEVFDIMNEWAKKNCTPYVDSTVQKYLDEGDLITVDVNNEKKNN